MIKSYSFNQHEILRDILALNELDRFDADVTYGNGSFYKEVPEPVFKYDVSPQIPGVEAADSCNLPLSDNCLQSLVFDPPFLTYVRAARDHNSIMAKRFGGYWTYDELVNHYVGTIQEAYRVLRYKGLLIVKCQDIIHNHKMHCTHANVIEWCSGLFRLKDLQLCVRSSKMPMPLANGYKPRVQKHARIHHSYFLTFERLKK